MKKNEKLCVFISMLILPVNVFAQVVSTFAGTGTVGYNGDGILAVNATLNNPNSVAIDAQGNAYLTDGYNNRVRKIDLSGIITTIAGTGTAGYNGDNIMAVNAQVSEATGALPSSSGVFYFAEHTGERIRKIDLSGMITTVGGTGFAGYSGDGGLAVNAEIDHPAGLSFDSANNIIIPDRDNHTVRKIDQSGVITTFAGTGISGFSGDGGLATNAQLNTPNKIAFDAAGNAYIADAYNNRIRKVTPAGIISTFAGTGVAGSLGDGGPATSAQLNTPRGVNVDAAGNVYICDFSNNKIRRINQAGIISTYAGTGVPGSAGDGGLPLNAQFKTPYQIAFDNTGNAYIVDSGNNKIRKITCQQPVITITTSDSVICPWNPATLNASGTDSYVWSSSSSGSSIVVTPSVTTSYSVTGTNTITGCRHTTVFTQNVSVCQGLKELYIEQGMTIYPNPANDQVFISSKHDITISVIDALGQTVKVVSLSQKNNYQYTVEGLATGVYFFTNTSSALSRKVIVLK